MKQLLAAFILFVFALTPASAQVQIDTGLTPSQMAQDAIDYHTSAVKLASYLLQTQADDSCVTSRMGNEDWTPWASACVFYDPIDPRVIFMALLSEDYSGEDTIYLMRDGVLFRMAQASTESTQSFLLVSDLPSGEYEVVFMWDDGDDELSTAFYFWIDERKEDSD